MPGDIGRASPVLGNRVVREGQLGLCKGSSGPAREGQVTLGRETQGLSSCVWVKGPTLLPRDSHAQLDTRCHPLKMAVGKENEQQQDLGQPQALRVIYLALACPACDQMMAEVNWALRAPHSPTGLLVVLTPGAGNVLTARLTPGILRQHAWWAPEAGIAMSSSGGSDTASPLSGPQGSKSPNDLPPSHAPSSGLTPRPVWSSAPGSGAPPRVTFSSPRRTHI